MIKLPHFEQCTACGACIDSCSREALSWIIDKNGFRRVIYSEKECVSCNACINICPILDIKPLDINDASNVEAYWGWSLNNEVRLLSSSGGIFAQLAYDFMRNNQEAIVVGASLVNGLETVHVVVDTIEDIYRLQGSKYMHSDTTGVYKKTLDFLRKGYKVLFSGTPCQIAGILKYVKGKKYKVNLYTVEVICHGIPSKRIFDFSLVLNNADCISSFRNKAENGWGINNMSFLREGRKCNAKDDFFYKAFFNDQYLRVACYDCKFARLPRIADISLADGWGVENIDKVEKCKGISLILTNNKKGEQLIRNSKNIHYTKARWKDFLYRNPNIVQNLHQLRVLSLSNYVDKILKFFPQNLSKYILSLSSPNNWSGIWIKPYILFVLMIKNKKMKLQKKYIKHFLLNTKNK